MHCYGKHDLIGLKEEDLTGYKEEGDYILLIIVMSVLQGRNIGKKEKKLHTYFKIRVSLRFFKKFLFLNFEMHIQDNLYICILIHNIIKC